MRSLLVLALLLTIALTCEPPIAGNILVSSNTSNTIIISSPSSSSPVVNEPYHTRTNPNYIGYNAQWLWQAGGQSWNDGLTVVFQTYFYVSCSAIPTLIITADNSFSAVLNNAGASFTGNNWYQTYKFSLNNIRCGLNTLRINVVNKDQGSPAALIFAVIQDQSSCFVCSSPLSFFNRKTCQCECLSSPRQFIRTAPSIAFPKNIRDDDCDNDQYEWKGYPICGYACSQKRACEAGKYFNDKTCRCQCQPKACIPGFTQSQNTCSCVKLNTPRIPNLPNYPSLQCDHN